MHNYGILRPPVLIARDRREATWLGRELDMLALILKHLGIVY